MTQPIQLLEYVQATAPMRVDREKGVIFEVKVLGNHSANGREYPPSTIEKARGLYEGIAVNVDHPARAGEAVSAGRRLGWLEGVYVKNGELWAKELHYLKSHPMAGQFAEAAERNPRLFGLSHNANGQGRRKDGRDVIESIDSVNSVDLVAEPATVGGLNEGKAVKKLVKQWIEELKAARPGFARALKEEVEAGIMSPDQPMEDPAPKGADETADHEVALKQGFRAAVLACLDDDGLDLKAKVKKIKEILQMEEKMLAKGEGGGDSTPADAAAAEEARKAAAGNLTEQRLRLQIKARDMLAEAKVEPNKVLLKALDGCVTEAEVKELIEDAKAARPAQRVQSAPPWTPPASGSGGKQIQESTAPEGDVKKLGAWLKG